MIDVAQRDMRKHFVHVVAEFLTEDIARKSIEAQVGTPLGRAWSRIWHASTLRGYPTLEEAEKTLEEFLDWI